jgi:hypothetical protein
LLRCAPYRPRFIDDRGVHCAVGHLIAASGATELARAINTDYEYAYVREMTSPTLLAWASARGFSIEELASIQPAYAGPPDPPSMHRELEREKDRIILACAGEAPPLSRIELRVTGSKHGVVTFKSKRDDAFSRCFAAKASELERGGGAYSPSPTPFEATIVVDLPSPQQLLDKWIAERTGYAPDCTPRPGTVPEQATIEIETAERG